MDQGRRMSGGPGCVWGVARGNSVLWQRSESADSRVWLVLRSYRPSSIFSASVDCRLW